MHAHSRHAQYARTEMSPSCLLFSCPCFSSSSFSSAQRPVYTSHCDGHVAASLFNFCTGMHFSASSLEDDPPATLRDVDRGYPAMIRGSLLAPSRTVILSTFIRNVKWEGLVQAVCTLTFGYVFPNTYPNVTLHLELMRKLFAQLYEEAALRPTHHVGLSKA